LGASSDQKKNVRKMHCWLLVLMLPVGILPLPTSEQDPTPDGVTGQESDSDSRWKQAAIVGQEADGSEETFVHPETLGLRWRRGAMAEPEPEGFEEPEPRLERDAEAEGMAEPEPEGSDGPKERVKRRVCEEVVICDSPIFGVCGRQIICDDGNPDPRLKRDAEAEGMAEPEPEGPDGPKERVKRRVCEEVVICDSPVFGVCGPQIVCDDLPPARTCRTVGTRLVCLDVISKREAIAEPGPESEPELESGPEPESEPEPEREPEPKLNAEADAEGMAESGPEGSDGPKEGQREGQACREEIICDSPVFGVCGPQIVCDDVIHQRVCRTVGTRQVCHDTAIGK